MKAKLIAAGMLLTLAGAAGANAQSAEQIRDERVNAWAATELSPQEAAQIQMVRDEVTAPNFTLENLDGKSVSLSDFRGKWVVLDFWGGWCPWCIKGIPEMKEMYAKYHDRGLEIIGIDCNEPQENWRAAVAKYDLPWVNVYNPAPRGEGVVAAYNVPGYPTKVIIDPEGRVFDIVVGEDPAFYTLLTAIFQ